MLTLAVAACGGGGNSDGVTSLSGSDKATATTNANSGRDNKPAAALNYARCMRQQGINLPDPKITPDGIDLPKASVKPDDPKFRAGTAGLRASSPSCPTIARSVAEAVRLGVRSRRPADQARVSIWDGCPGGCPSGCPAVGSE